LIANGVESDSSKWKCGRDGDFHENGTGQPGAVEGISASRCGTMVSTRRTSFAEFVFDPAVSGCLRGSGPISGQPFEITIAKVMADQASRQRQLTVQAVAASQIVETEDWPAPIRQLFVHIQTLAYLRAGCNVARICRPRVLAIPMNYSSMKLILISVQHLFTLNLRALESFLGYDVPDCYKWVSKSSSRVSVNSKKSQNCANSKLQSGKSPRNFGDCVSIEPRECS